jgi:hypothetical protein
MDGGRPLPDHTNVFGRFVSPGGLDPVLRALQAMASDGEVFVYHGKSLRLRTAVAEFDSDALPDRGEYLFNGSVGGSVGDVESFVSMMSDLLVRAGIGHRFELYSDGRLVRTIPAQV